jgi:hypothetical protein
MTLYCAHLQPGDRVRLRNGDIQAVKENDGSGIPICLDNDDWYYGGGTRRSDGTERPLDIIEILPPDLPTDCTSHEQAVGRAKEILCKTETAYGGEAPLPQFSVGGKVIEVQADPARPIPRPATRVLTIDGTFDGIKHPPAIKCNGKRYVPADSPLLSPCSPFKMIEKCGEGIIMIIHDGKEFTPADAWPEQIRDRPPTADDADPKGLIRRLDSDGNWICVDWACFDWACSTAQDSPCGWARTEHWKPKHNPVYDREEVLEMLRDSKSIAALSLAHAQDDPDLLDSIIAHLESSDE